MSDDNGTDTTRPISQDILLDAIMHLNIAERDLFALNMLADESYLWASYRAAEDGEPSLTIGEVLSRVRTHAVRYVRKE